MWIEAARMYIPGADKFSDEKVNEVNIPSTAINVALAAHTFRLPPRGVF